MTLPSQQPAHTIRANSLREPLATVAQRPWPMLVALLPLLIVDELGLFLRADSVPENLAREQLRLVMQFFDLPPMLALTAGGFIIFFVLLIWHLLQNDPWRFRPAALLWIPLQGAAWTLPLLVLSMLFAASTLAVHTTEVTMAALPQVDRLLVSLSAGLYEELLFRMVGIALLHAIFVDVLRLRNGTGTGLAILGTALAFAWYHDPIASPALGVFAFVAGLELGMLFVWRGFAVVVWTHVLYDIAVTML